MLEVLPLLDDDGALWLHRATIRPDWVDYNGHMSEAYYVLIFGDATDAFYDHVGLGDAYRTAQGVSVYTLEAHIRYLVEGHAGEDLRIATRLIAHDSKRLRLHHAMHRAADNELLAVTEVMVMHVDKAAMRASPFPPHFAESFAALRCTAIPVPAQSRHWLERVA